MPPLLKPIGTSGLRQSGGYVDADFLPKLRGQEGAKQFEEMASNDPVVSAMVFAIEMLIRRTQWRVEPFEKNDQSKAAQEWLENCLFEEMDQDWSDFLSEVSTMFVYGFAPHEILYKRLDDNSIGLRALALRQQTSISRWNIDEATYEVLGVYQQDWTHPEVHIPIEKIALFRTRNVAGNPEGRSALRGAYVQWVRKKAIEEAEGRAALRAAGIVKVSIPGEYMLPGVSDDQLKVLNAWSAIANKLAQDRQGAVIVPSDVHPESKAPLFNVEYVVADGRRPGDMSPIVERIDKRIAATVLADFILLGQQSVGSFALSSDKTQLFATVMDGWNQMIAGTLNKQVVPKLWKLNGFPDETRPYLAAQPVQKKNLTEFADFLSKLSAAGMPLFPDPELQAFVRQTADLPETDEEKLIQQQMDMKEEEAARMTAAETPPQEKAPPPPKK